MSIFNFKRFMSPSSPEIQKLHDEIKEIELRTYQEKLKQKKKKLLEEENEIKNGDVATFDEREAEKKEIYKIMLGAILAYTLLTLFMFSTFFIIYKLQMHGCHGSDFVSPTPTPILIPSPEPTGPPTGYWPCDSDKECTPAHTGYSAGAHAFCNDYGFCEQKTFKTTRSEYNEYEDKDEYEYENKYDKIFARIQFELEDSSSTSSIDSTHGGDRDGGTSVDVYWIGHVSNEVMNFQKEVYDGSIQHGKPLILDTYVGHTFRFHNPDNDAVYSDYIIAPNHQVYSVKASSRLLHTTEYEYENDVTQQQLLSCNGDATTDSFGRFQFYLRMDFDAANYQKETAWKLVANTYNNPIIASVPKEELNEKRIYVYPRDDNNANNNNNNKEDGVGYYCLPTNTCYTLSLADTSGDGLNSGEGSYTGYLDENIVFDGDGDFESEISHVFCVGNTGGSNTNPREASTKLNAVGRRLKNYQHYQTMSEIPFSNDKEKRVRSVLSKDNDDYWYNHDNDDSDEYEYEQKTKNGYFLKGGSGYFLKGGSGYQTNKGGSGYQTKPRPIPKQAYLNSPDDSADVGEEKTPDDSADVGGGKTPDDTADDKEGEYGEEGQCLYYLRKQFHRNSAIVTLHNLMFGLVSAVVVSQIGIHQQQQQQGQEKNRSINNQLLHAAKSAFGLRRIVLFLVYNFITWTPRIYIVMWILTGCACLLCGVIWGSEYSGPLYITGQAWLGIAITTVYLFFGLQETAKEKEKDNEEEGTKNNDKRSYDDTDEDFFDVDVIPQDDIPL